MRPVGFSPEKEKKQTQRSGGKRAHLPVAKTGRMDRKKGEKQGGQKSGINFVWKRKRGETPPPGRSPLPFPAPGKKKRKKGVGERRRRLPCCCSAQRNKKEKESRPCVKAILGGEGRRKLRRSPTSSNRGPLDSFVGRFHKRRTPRGEPLMCAGKKKKRKGGRSPFPSPNCQKWANKSQGERKRRKKRASGLMVTFYKASKTDNRGTTLVQ